MEITNQRTHCPFCVIAENVTEYPWVVYKDLSTIAFFPDYPATLGHTLVIPPNHAENLWDLDVEQSCSMMETGWRIARAIRGTFEPDGLNLIQSNGKLAEQTVYHVHLHLLPRYKGDRIGPIWPNNRPIPKEDKKAAQKALARAIDLRD